MPSAVPKLDPAACARRNLAAALEGRNAAPLRLTTVPPPPPGDGYRVVTARGSLPATDAEAVALINARLGLAGADALPREKVLLVYPEAANRSYINKYQMFLGVSTLKNIQESAADGIALMNSHRTGGMSTPAEQPYGRTFAARMEYLAGPGGDQTHRVVLGGYMLSGVYPNGANGPSTDDLHASIVAGTLNEVSLGFSSRGMSVCDVCGKDMEELDLDGRDYICPHSPGTHRSMTAEQVAAQKARGVPGGVCTFTLEGADVNELSAVYSGALTGAGFRKTARLARQNRLAAAELYEARAAFAPLLSADPAALGPPPTRPPITLTDGDPPVAHQPPETPTLADVFAFWDATGRPQIPLADLTAQLSAGGRPPAPPAPASAPPPAAPPVPAPAPSPAAAGNAPTVETQLAALREQMERERDERVQEKERDRRAAVALAADAWADGLIRLGRLTPAERVEQVNLYNQAAADDAGSPAQVAYRDPRDNTPKLGTRVDALKASLERRPAAPNSRQLVAADPSRAPVGPPPGGAGGTTLGPEPADPEGMQLQAIYDSAAKWATHRNGPAARGANGAR